MLRNTRTGWGESSIACNFACKRLFAQQISEFHQAMALAGLTFLFLATLGGVAADWAKHGTVTESAYAAARKGGVSKAPRIPVVTSPRAVQPAAGHPAKKTAQSAYAAAVGAYASTRKNVGPTQVAPAPHAALPIHTKPSATTTVQEVAATQHLTLSTGISGKASDTCSCRHAVTHLCIEDSRCMDATADDACE